VGRLREDDFLDRDAVRRLEREPRRNQRRVFGCVRLRVVALGQAHRDGAAHGVALARRRHRKNGRQLRQLRCTLAEAQRQQDGGAERSEAERYSTLRNGITSARGSGPKSSPNLTGGRSWNMKSHFQRSDGLEAWSQLRAETGRENAMPRSAP